MLRPQSKLLRRSFYFDKRSLGFAGICQAVCGRIPNCQQLGIPHSYMYLAFPLVNGGHHGIVGIIIGLTRIIDKGIRKIFWFEFVVTASGWHSFCLSEGNESESFRACENV